MTSTHLFDVSLQLYGRLAHHFPCYIRTLSAHSESPFSVCGNITLLLLTVAAILLKYLPVLIALEFSGDFVVPVELASMKMDDVIRGAQEVVWRMALLTKRKVIVFHVDAERVCFNSGFKTAMGKDGVQVVSSEPDYHQPRAERFIQEALECEPKEFHFDTMNLAYETSDP